MDNQRQVKKRYTRILVTNKCNQDCIYCNAVKSKDRDNLSFSPESIRSLIKKNKNTKVLIISGGEPSVCPYLEDYVGYAKKQGYKKVVLLTNGEKFVDKELCRRLQEAGLTEAQVSFPHLNPAIFDMVTQSQGSFDRVVKAISNLQNEGVIVAASIVVSVFNYQTLEQLVAYAHATLKIKRIMFIFIENCMRVEKHLWMIPDIRNAVKYMQKAVSYCEAHGLRFKFSGTGLPLCILKKNRFPYERRDFAKGANFYRRDSRHIYKPECSTCRERFFCSGFLPWHIQKYKRNFNVANEQKYAHVTVQLTDKCNNRCIYCYGAGPPEDIEKNAIKQRLWQLRLRNVKHVSFSGGEPTVSEQLPELIEYAHESGFSKIAVSTNGRRFAYADYCNYLFSKGLSSVCISYPAHTEKLFGKITGGREGYDQAAAAIENLKKLKAVNLEAVIPVTKLNYKYIPKIVEQLIKLGVRFIGIQYLLPVNPLHYSTYSQSDVSQSIPRYMDVYPYVKEAINRYRSEAYLYIENVPPCYVRGLEERVVTEAFSPDCYLVTPSGRVHQIRRFITKGAVKTAECKSCEYVKKCIGFYFEYTAEYGIEDRIKITNHHSCVALDLQHGPCEYDCVFCTRHKDGMPFYKIREDGPLEIDFEYLHNFFRYHQKHGFEVIHIFGRERADAFNEIYRIVSLAKANGFKQIYLWSSGLRFADKNTLKRLIAAGVTSFKMPIYGYSGVVHDRVVNRKNSFAQLKKGLLALREVGSEQQLHVIVIRKNVRTFAKLCRVIAEDLKQSFFYFLMYMPEGEFNYRGENTYRNNVVSFTEVLRSLEGFKSPLKVITALIPFCISEKLKKNFKKVVTHDIDNSWVMSLSNDGIEYKEVQQNAGCIFTDVCENCLHRPHCCGIMKSYYDIFGDKELTPAVR